MNRLTDKQLLGHYGAFNSRPGLFYEAIAVARMIQFRGLKLPRGFDKLLLRVKESPDLGYAHRRKFLGYFGIATYQKYLKSELWAAVRKLALEAHDGRCNFCGVEARQVNHRSYDLATLSGATVERLYPTCGDCHRLIEFDELDRKRTFDEVVAETIARAL